MPALGKSDSEVAQEEALASIGLTPERARELTELLTQLHGAGEDTEAALEALLQVSALDAQDDAARIFLMGGGIQDALADLICICDDDWVSAPSDSSSSDAPSASDRRSALELCSRALNALGALASFAPFVASIMEEDRTDERMDSEVVQMLARHINEPAQAAAAAGGAQAAVSTRAGTAVSPAASSASSAPFRPRRFSRRSELAYYPLLVAVLFWLRTDVHRSTRSQAVFALSWLLTHRPLAALLTDVGLPAFLFELLERQLSETGTGSRSGSITPDSSSSAGSGGAGGERVSVTQDNIRLYACICLQRLSRAGFPLFADPMEAAGTADARLQLLLRLLSSVHSFNVRAIILNILLQAVTPRGAAASATSFAAAAASASSAPAAVDLTLPPSALDALHDFRNTCGSIIGSSRRTSPALGALAISSAAARGGAQMPPMPPMHALPAQAAAGGSGASSARSWRAPSPIMHAAPPSSDSTSAADDAAEDDEVAELSRDPEAGIDKTAHLQQLVDAIVAASNASSAQAATANASS